MQAPSPSNVPKILNIHDITDEMAAELSAEIPDKHKIIAWLKQLYSQAVGGPISDMQSFREWLIYQQENSDVPFFFRRYSRLQTVISIDLSSKIDSIKQRRCHVCNPTGPDQPAFPIFNFVLRIRGRSRQSISSSELSAYQLAIRQHLNRHQGAFRKFSNYCMALTFVLNRSKRDRDVDNMSKTVLDAVSRALRFNDATVSHLDALKLRLLDAEECIYIKISPSYVDSARQEDVVIKELHQVFAVGPPLS